MNSDARSDPAAPLSALVRKSALECRAKMASFSEQPALKIVFITLFAVGLFIGLWALFVRGFNFLGQFPGATAIIFGRLFSLFFLGMGLMIAVSGIVTSYATIFRSDEIPFLITRPFTNASIVLYKFGESILLASWAFFFIILPFLGAYTSHAHLSLAFPVFTLLLSIPFIIICAGTGALLTLLLVRWFPFARAMRWFGWGLLMGGVALLWCYMRRPETEADQATFLLSQLIPGLQLASSPLLPSRWLSESVFALTTGDWPRGVMLSGVLVSNALMLVLLVHQVGGALYLEAWQRVAYAPREARKPSRILSRVDVLFSPLPQDLQAIVIKDVRIFFRDPMQWTQFLVFFGLLAMYFLNLRSFHYHLLEDRWRNAIAFLNIFSVSAVMCSLGSRFVFPQLSIEGQQFWILGLSPVSMTKILMGKFVLSLIGMVSAGFVLVQISGNMLQLDATSQTIATVLSLSVSCAIAALSTGLGAVFIDLKQRNPAAIVSGFGGTLNLVLCLLFMILSIVPFGVLFQLHFYGKLTGMVFTQFLWIGAAWLLLITVAATVIPLAAGCRTLNNREY